MAETDVGDGGQGYGVIDEPRKPRRVVTWSPSTLKVASSPIKGKVGCTIAKHVKAAARVIPLLACAFLNIGWRFQMADAVVPCNSSCKKDLERLVDSVHGVEYVKYMRVATWIKTLSSKAIANASLPPLMPPAPKMTIDCQWQSFTTTAPARCRCPKQAAGWPGGRVNNGIYHSLLLPK